MTVIEDTFTDLELSKLHALAEDKKASGARFIELHATTVDDGFVLTYAFTDDEKTTDNYNVHIAQGEHVPAISDLFLSAFVFENETHDLFGIPVDGIAIDFKGNFYQVALDHPMAMKTKDSDMFSVENKNETVTPRETKEVHE